jgi:hypothetical protein
MIIVKVRSDRRRIWEYFLRKKYHSKKKLEILIEYLVIKTVADEAKKEVDELEKKTK